MVNKKEQRIKRHARVRRKIVGKEEKPRLSVFRSNKHIYAQIINDAEGKTLVSISDVKLEKKEKVSKIEKAHQAGIDLAKIAQQKKIKNLVFDRNGFKYHGRVKALAEGAREGGLLF